MFEDIVQRAFAEDLPDITSEAIFDAEDHGAARFLIKGEGVLAGLAVLEAVFRPLDPAAQVTLRAADERSWVFRPRERNRYSRLCFSTGFTSQSKLGMQP